MVNYYERGLDRTFAALSDPVRRALLKSLAGGQKSVSQLAHPFAISMPAVLKHLSYLEKAGLVSGSKKGRVRTFQFVAAPMQNAAEWIAAYRRFWEGQFDSLERYLSAQPKEESPRKSKKRNPRQRSPSGGRSEKRLASRVRSRKS